MSYDSARQHLARASVASKNGSADPTEDLITALEEPTDALEKGLTRGKIALGRMARHLQALH